MSAQPNRGVTKTLVKLIGKMTPHTQITHEDDDFVESLRPMHPQITKASVQYALRDLKHKGLIEPTGVAGIYEKPNGTRKPKPEPEADVEVVVIDNLLDAMAKAEPVLKRMKKLLSLLDAIK